MLINLPWKHLTYEQTVEAYKDLFLEVHKLSEQHADISVRGLLVRSELFKHDFSKRQMNILMFIITFSYLYGKEWAYIPKLQDFEIAGISKTHIKNELTKLEKMNVLIYNREENLFKIKEPTSWDVSQNLGYNDTRNKELILLNLDHTGLDVTKIIEKLKQMK